MLREVAGQPLIEWVVRRARAAASLAGLVLATSCERSDDELAARAADLGVRVHRGPLADVAERVHDCVQAAGWDYFVRINGDSPLLSPRLIDCGVRLAIHNRLEFVTNLWPRTYPYGVAVEVIRTETFARSLRETRDPADREHITRWFYRNIDRLRYMNVLRRGEDDSDVRLTVDTPEDLARIGAVLEALDTPDCDDLERIVATARRLQEPALAGAV